MDGHRSGCFVEDGNEPEDYLVARRRPVNKKQVVVVEARVRESVKEENIFFSKFI